MKNIERGSVKYLVVLILMVAIMGIILYPTFDFLIDKFIRNTKFVYSFSDHVIQPIIFACAYSLVYWSLDRKRNK